MEEIIVGLVRRPHGLDGEVHVQVETDSPERVFAAGRVLAARAGGATAVEADGSEEGVTRPDDAATVGGAPRFLTVASARAASRGWLVRFREVTDRAAAERVRGRLLSLPRSELAQPGPGEFFAHDLVGLEVRDEEDGVVGRVEAVYRAAAQPLLAVRHAGRERLIPFHASVIVDVDRSGGKIRIRPPAGLLEL